MGVWLANDGKLSHVTPVCDFAAMVAGIAAAVVLRNQGVGLIWCLLALSATVAALGILGRILVITGLSRRVQR